MPGSPINYRFKKIIAIKNLSNQLLLTWVINNICTNHCSYCPSNLHSGTNHHYDWDHARKFIEQCFEKYGSIQCNLSGGEPTVSPFFKELVNLIYDNGGVTNLTTNLVRKKEWWEDIADKLCTISVSYHPEFMKTAKEEDELIDKILFLEKHTRVSVRVMMHPDYWDQCINFYKKLEKLNTGFCMEIVRILPNFGIGDPFCTISYTEEQNDILNNTPPISKWSELPASFRHNKTHSVIVNHDGTTQDLDFQITSTLENNKLTNFQDWECDIGLESLFVHYDGRVQRGNCGQGGFIGNIMENVSWPTESIVCNKNVCHCIADVLISKRIT
jgi:MoaA/NifB/PqqE/SkfB family radical SAM enzyme